MPVRFETASEYNRNFQGPSGPLPTAYPVAGLKSEHLANVDEPRLQSRKKPRDLQRTSTTYLDEGPLTADDYILVGDQSKFAPSVKYRVLDRHKAEAVQASGDAGQPSEPVHSHCEGDTRPPDSPKPEKRKAQTKKAKEENGAANGVENGAESPTGERSPPPAPREKDIAPAIPKGKPSNYISRPTKPTLKTRPPPAKKPKAKPPVPKLAIKEKKAEVKERENEPEVLERRPADPREKRSGKFNEFVQTDMAKGVADSGQEATADYAMKYRAGIAPPRKKGPKRLSEYQMQFQWKKGVSSSPLLAAEQIIYNSNPHMAPYSNPDLIPKESEYNRAFREFKYKPMPVEVTEGPKKSKSKLKRSKSLEALSPAVKAPTPSQTPAVVDSQDDGSNEPVGPHQLRAAGMMSGKRTEEDKRLLRESLNPTHVLFPHGRTRNVASEYDSNFLNPTRYSYEEGVWKGADPPHIQPAKSPAPVNAKKQAKAARAARETEAPTSPVQSPTWFQEVLELRNKAQEYKQRARGTHFGRSHLAQLYAQQADLWDTVSNSSVLSALSLESAGAMAARQASDRGSIASTVTPKEQPQPKPGAKPAWSDEQVSTTKGTSVASLQGSPPGSAGGSVETQDTVVAGSTESQQGRIPTPKFRKEHDQAGYKWRHHLDRTTPAVGGALLTSPPQRKKTKSRTKSEPALKVAPSVPKVRCTCKSDESDQSDSDDSPTYRINYPEPPYVQYPRNLSEHIQPVKTHTNTPVFHFLPERKMAHIKKSSQPMFRTTKRPIMVPQVAARLVDPYNQHGVEEAVVDEPRADGYVNPVYLGEGEIMQPSAVGFISPEDARYALVPRYVPRTFPGPRDEVVVKDDTPAEELMPASPSPKSALRAGPTRQVSASWAGPLAGGLPTRDSHVLVDEEASTDRPLPTKYTQSPPIDKQSKRPTFAMPTLKETLRELNTGTDKLVDDDVLSVSARSVASSCSLASEVLERAKNRRDEFWGANARKIRS